MEEKMIKNLEENTGIALSEWIKIVKDSGEVKHNAIIKHLKSNHGLTHGYANLVAHKAKKSDAGSSDTETLIADQYKGKESLKPIYDKIIGEMAKLGNDIEIAPKKAYVSLRRKKQFGLIKPSTKTRIDLGLNIKGREPSGKLELSGSFNSMVSHRVRIVSIDEVSPELIGWIKEAYNNAG